MSCRAVLARMAVALRCAVLGLLAALAAAPAWSQEMPTVLPQNYVLSDILNRQRIEAAIGTPRDRSARASAQRPDAGAAAAPRVRSAAATQYQPSPAVSARVQRQFVDWMGKQAGADAARQVSTAMARTDPLRNWSQLVAADGLRPNDLADALAAYWILNWVMANGADSTRAQALAVREQLRAILADAPQGRMDDAKRQELSEIFILNFLIQHAAYEGAVRGGDRAVSRRLGDAAAARFRNEMGLDLRQLRLTDGGFVPAASAR
jgi:hypothetical protein